jgi:hypothetical protein
MADCTCLSRLFAASPTSERGHVFGTIGMGTVAPSKARARAWAVNAETVNAPISGCSWRLLWRWAVTALSASLGTPQTSLTNPLLWLSRGVRAGRSSVSELVWPVGQLGPG